MECQKHPRRSVMVTTVRVPAESCIPFSPSMEAPSAYPLTLAAALALFLTVACSSEEERTAADPEVEEGAVEDTGGFFL